MMNWEQQRDINLAKREQAMEEARLAMAQSAVKNDRASDRLQAANAMSMAAQGYSVYNAVNKMITKDPKSNTYLLRVESGTGVAHSPPR